MLFNLNTLYFKQYMRFIAANFFSKIENQTFSIVAKQHKKHQDTFAQCLTIRLPLFLYHA